MNRRSFFGFLIALLVLPGPQVCGAGEMPASSEPQQMEDFDLSGYGADGQKTWEVDGATMDMLGDEIKINDITARMFGDQENLVVTADHGRFDKQSGVVHLTDNVRAVTDGGMKLNTETLDWSQAGHVITTDKKVQVQRDNLTAVGTGLKAEPDAKIAKFEKDVVLTIDQQKGPEEAAARPPRPMEEPFGGPGKLTITCDGPMELNYDKQTAVFHDNVRVESADKQGTMIADTMTVRFDTQTRQIDRIEAEGNVQIQRDGNTSYSNSAVFTNAERKVILTGRPKLVLFMEAGAGLGVPIVQEEKPGKTP